MGCFTVYRPGAPARWKRTLKTKDRKLAQRLADALGDAGTGRLAERQIAQVVESVPDGRAKKAARKVFSDVHRAVTGRDIGAGTLRNFVQAWLKTMEPELALQSFARYQQVARDFLKFAGAEADRDLTTFSSRDETLVFSFRDALAGRLSRASVNVSLKIVRQFFKAAEMRFKIENPARFVSGLKSRGEESSRRAFALPELGRLLRESKDSEWHGIILAGLYTGQRISDIASWRWENIDLARRELAFTSRKTGRRMIMPVAEPLAEYLESQPATDEAKAFVFTIAAGHVMRAKSEQSATLSNQFYDLLARTGLVRRRSHARANEGKGRSARRRPSEISFHSLRHTATSLLKNAGVSQATVMDLIGHESKAVSQLYTHVGDTEKRQAIAALPSLTQLMRAVDPKRATAKTVQKKEAAKTNGR